MNALLARLADPRPLIMGILNVTPDSFSDGGHFSDPGLALARAVQMAAEGADIIDVGGESTRPGAGRVDAAEQIRRTQAVIATLRAQVPADVTISIDTTLPAVAAAALEAGAGLINDVQAGEEAGMLELAADRGVPIVLMHMPAPPATMQIDPCYGNVVDEVHNFLAGRADHARRCGIAPGHIIVDPGIGFGKARLHNLLLLQSLDRLAGLGYVVLLGASRKRFMGSICRDTAPRDLCGATCATTALGVQAGVRILRVHDVRANRQAADVAWAIRHPA